MDGSGNTKSLPLIPQLIVAFDRPQHGWVGLKLESDDATFFDAISYTPTDIFTALCNTLCTVLDGVDPAVAVFYANPAAYELRFATDESDGNISCELYSWSAAHRIMGRRKREFAVRGTPRAILLPFWRALRSLHASMTPQEFLIAWRRDFPESELAQLTKRVNKALKNVR
jgi:hypothetical protein